MAVAFVRAVMCVRVIVVMQIGTMLMCVVLLEMLVMSKVVIWCERGLDAIE